MQSIAIIGLGRFGMELVRALSEKKDVDVMAIDTNPEIVTEAGKYIRNVFVCDCKQESAIREIGIQNVDHAIVAFGQSENSKLIFTILVTILLKKIGVPEITVRLDNEMYEDTIRAIGATNIIYPLKMASERMANRLCSSLCVDNISLTEKYNIFELKVSSTFKELALLELADKIRQKINIILIKRDSKTFIPTGADSIKGNDTIFIFGKENKINKIANFFTEETK